MNVSTQNGIQRLATQEESVEIFDGERTEK
jgi:hypothetical protein